MMAIGFCDVLFMIYFCSADLFFSENIHEKYDSRPLAKCALRLHLLIGECALSNCAVLHFMYIAKP